MMQEEILSEIKEEFHDFSDIEQLTEDTDLWKHGMESIDFVRIVVMLEEIYDIEFEDEFLQMKYFNCVKDFAEYVEKRLETK